MISYIGTNNMQGYYGRALLSLGTDNRIVAEYPSRFVFQNIDSYVDAYADIVIILGFSFNKSETGSFIESLKQANLYGNPMTQVYHFASFGDVIEDPEIESYVDEELSPVLLMKKVLSRADTVFSKINKNQMFVHELANAINEYHTYTFNTTGNTDVLKLKHLADAKGKDVYKYVVGASSVRELVHSSEDIIKPQEEKFNEYISRKLELANVFTVQDTVVVMLYAEQYVNEIAHAFITNYQMSGFEKVVVMVGRQTRGDDLFSIRVSKGLDASEIAKVVNGGKGKEGAATVFLGRPLDSLANIVHKQILKLD